MLREVLEYSTFLIHLTITIVSLSDAAIGSNLNELFDGFLFIQISEKKPCLLNENLPCAGISIQLSTNQIFLGAASVG